jgi:Coenzyme PQQ synthesis protein D (PqqD)
VARYVVPSADVPHERVDDEVIVINLLTGTYFSLREAAADVWTMLTDGADLDGVAAALAEAHGLDQAAVHSDVACFVDALVDAGLLVVDAAGVAVPAHGSVPRSTAAYEPPVLERFEDMEELLLLDPIHEVDESGWPVLPIEPR